ncbi:hypothetical protein [Ureibacillus terrenus]|uniref:Uncharacterized protein n=1 Tax=Ureibacillus terrenus TaxID=118246 RepID=A0A540UW19_9BACL|nr:hypothetical protein [Ureibacillus terrenus]TQE88685.1 hypothetical protein FKZ59_13465 [Ureibacillus terrenus]
MGKRSDYEDYSDEELKDRAEYDYDAREELKLRGYDEEEYEYKYYSTKELMERAKYDYKAVEELSSRGYHKIDGEWVSDEAFAFEMLGLLFKIGMVLAILLGTHFLVAYSMDYQVYVFAAFAITFLLMVLGRGTSKVLNFLFSIGCVALATRCYPVVFEFFVGTDYFDYFLAGPNLWEWIKYALIYIAYVAVVPFLVMLFITFFVRTLAEKKEADVQ